MEIEQQEKKGYNNCGKSSYIINNPNYKWIELTNQKAQSRGMDYTTRPNYMLPAGDSAQLQRQTQAQSEGAKMILQTNGIQREVGVAVLI